MPSFDLGVSTVAASTGEHWTPAVYSPPLKPFCVAWSEALFFAESDSVKVIGLVSLVAGLLPRPDLTATVEAGFELAAGAALPLKAPMIAARPVPPPTAAMTSAVPADAAVMP